MASDGSGFPRLRAEIAGLRGGLVLLILAFVALLAMNAATLWLVLRIAARVGALPA